MSTKLSIVSMVTSTRTRNCAFCGALSNWKTFPVNWYLNYDFNADPVTCKYPYEYSERKVLNVAALQSCSPAAT